MRKKKENTEKLTARHNLLLSASEKQKAIIYAESMGISVNSLIRLLLKQQIKSIERAKIINCN